MSSVTWDAEIAGVYDDTYTALFDPSFLGPMTGLLAELARDGPAVEFAVGSGRVALALSARGVAVHGIELSRPMTERLSAKLRFAVRLTTACQHDSRSDSNDASQQLAWASHSKRIQRGGGLPPCGCRN